MHHRAKTRELVFEQLGFQPDAVTRALDDGMAGRGFTAHKQGYAEHALYQLKLRF
jgi:hypothetical protein